MTRPRSRPRSEKYGLAHQTVRKRYKVLVEAGGVACWRCGMPIAPGEPWDLGHDDTGHRWMGPEHRACNRRDGAVKAARALIAREDARTLETRLDPALRPPGGPWRWAELAGRWERLSREW